MAIMKKFVLLVMFLYSTSSLAHHADLYNQVELRLHMLKITIWIETHSDMNTKNIPLPNIDIVHEADICKMAFSDSVATNLKYDHNWKGCTTT